MTQLEYNAGNLQEYDYECEWTECYWKQIHNMAYLVTACIYPWLKINTQD